MTQLICCWWHYTLLVRSFIQSLIEHNTTITFIYIIRFLFFYQWEKRPQVHASVTLNILKRSVMLSDTKTKIEKLRIEKQNFNKLKYFSRYILQSMYTVYTYLYIQFKLHNIGLPINDMLCYIKSYHLTRRSHFVSSDIMNEVEILLLLHISIRICKFKNSWKIIFGKSSRFALVLSL